MQKGTAKEAPNPECPQMHWNQQCIHLLPWLQERIALGTRILEVHTASSALASR